MGVPCAWENEPDAFYACCLDGWRCENMHPCECLDAGGTLHPLFVEQLCGSDPGFCNAPAPPPGDPEECRTKRTFVPDPANLFHTRDICETAIAGPTRITDPNEPDEWAPTTWHKCRATPAPGLGNDACQYHEAKVVLDYTWLDDLAMVVTHAVPLMCTHSQPGNQHAVYSRGIVFIEKSLDPNSPVLDSNAVLPLGAAGIMHSVEAPFWAEANLFADGAICGTPNE